VSRRTKRQERRCRIGWLRTRRKSQGGKDRYGGNPGYSQAVKWDAAEKRGRGENGPYKGKKKNGAWANLRPEIQTQGTNLKG